MLVLSHVRQWKPAQHRLPLLIVALAGLSAGGAAYAATEKPGATRQMRFEPGYYLYSDLYEAFRARRERGEIVDEAWLRAITTTLAQSAAFERHGSDKNMAIEEDSPGNYVLRHDGKDWVFVWYDSFGGEHEMPLWD